MQIAPGIVSAFIWMESSGFRPPSARKVPGWLRGDINPPPHNPFEFPSFNGGWGEGEPGGEQRLLAGSQFTAGLDSVPGGMPSTLEKKTRSDGVWNIQPPTFWNSMTSLNKIGVGLIFSVWVVEWEIEGSKKMLRMPLHPKESSLPWRFSGGGHTSGALEAVFEVIPPPLGGGSLGSDPPSQSGVKKSPVR